MRPKSGIRCSTKAALTMMPSVPSFCMAGRPLRSLLVTSLPRPALRKVRPGIERRSVLTTAPSSESSWMSNSAVSTSWMRPKLWLTRSTRIMRPLTSTIFHQARLSIVVPQRAAFLPPALMATLPPMQQASAEAGSTAKTRPAAAAASSMRRVTQPAPHSITGCSPSTPGRRRMTGPLWRSNFSILITAVSGCSGTAPPV